jgi:hypothetical protein
MQFLIPFTAQIIFGSLTFLGLFYGLIWSVTGTWLEQAILNGQLYWIVTCSLFGLIMSALFFTRKQSGISLYFLDFH